MKTAGEKLEAAVMLHNIRSAHNVGSIFRTADAVGVSTIFLCGLTPSPIDRFGRLRPDIVKVALGAERTVKWSYEKNSLRTLRTLKKEGFQIIALEQAVGSMDYRKIKPARKFLLIVGNEVSGLPKEILRNADVITEIPMSGRKESLNVSVAFGIALFQL